MAVPKRKTTPSKRGMRRGHDAISSTAYIEDKDSGELRRPHHIDLKSGMYRGKQILTPKEDYTLSVQASADMKNPVAPKRCGVFAWLNAGGVSV